MSALQKALKNGQFGVTAEMAPPKGYDFTEQMEAAELLRGTELGMGQIAQQIGYESASKFSAEFRKHFGLLPSEYRKMHK